MKYFILILMVFLGLKSQAQGLGIRFQATDWENAQELATKENKLIFIDAYTDWCAPCKIMEEHVFTHQWAGDFFNPNFINLKMDMEKSIGQLFVARYGIQIYPCFLFLSPDGTLVYKTEGYMNVEKLIAQGKIANQPYLYTKAMDDRFNEGDRMPPFLYNYLFIKKKNNDNSHQAILPLYLEAQRNWSDENAIQLIFEFVDKLDSEMFKYMSNHKADYREVIGQEKFDLKFDQYIQTAIRNDDQPLSLDKRADIYRIAYPQKAERMIVDFELDHYEKNGPENIYAEKAFTYYTTIEKNNPSKIRSLIPIFRTHLKSEEAKSFVLNWTLTEAVKENTPSAWKSLAQWHLEQGNHEKAMELAKKAYKMAKKEKLPKSSYKLLISNIKKAIKAA